MKLKVYITRPRGFFRESLPELVHIYYSDLRDFDLRDKIFARINRVKRGLPVMYSK